MHDRQVFLLEIGRMLHRIRDPKFEIGGFCYPARCLPLNCPASMAP